MINVLYLHPVGAFGGASKSLIELYKFLKDADVQGTVLTPRGKAATAFADVGMVTHEVNGLSQFDNTRFGHYRRLRWLILLREVAYLPVSLLALWRLRKQHFDLLHVNEVTLLPLALFAKKLLRLPMVVHVRSLQCQPDGSRRSRLLSRWLMRYADAVVAIDHTVARTLDRSLGLHVVHNSLRVANSDPYIKTTRAAVQPVKVGFIGVLIGLKGIYELIEAMRILKERNVSIECLIAGENARELHGIRAWALRKLGFAQDVRSELESLIRRYGLERHIQLLGFVKDVPNLYRTLDILCFPSHLNAAGRSVFEAALFEVPSVVALNDPLPDAVIHGQTGIAIPQPSPELIADALEVLAQDDDYRMTLGRNARTWAIEQFSEVTSAEAMLRIYRQIIRPST